MPADLDAAAAALLTLPYAKSMSLKRRREIARVVLETLPKGMAVVELGNLGEFLDGRKLNDG